jgi:dTDP-4-dehydrorhamnose reductase
LRLTGGPAITISNPPELWGGHECTVNRVGDRYFDQTIRSGHQHRLSDLDRFAGLGVTALRYPVLWERVSASSPDERDWSWSDERLGRLRELEVRPIVGLVHHGSGPRYTSLMEDSFAPGLAAHARAVAERYPWVTDFTPVNEPLTTARFSALYGFWYPHLRDEGAFWSALLNEVDATRLAMRAIRQVTPRARLIQTEDLGQTSSTEHLYWQADYENERRWITWDLLCGRVDRSHRFWEEIARHGLEDRLQAIVDDPCPPDVVGVNHYVTSERFLDERLERYPPSSHGGNGWASYADVEAVRVSEHGPIGFEALLRQVWERYGLTIAVTECHIGCTREEQLRWFRDCWQGVGRLRAEGVPVEAVTAWSLLGAYDWSCLLTADRDCYEPGVFDLRTGYPRPTALVPLLTALSRGETPPIPALAGEGWWRRDIRYAYPPVRPAQQEPAMSAPAVVRHAVPGDGRPLLITGATGTLGQAFARLCRLRGLEFVLTDRRRLAVEDPGSIAAAMASVKPWAVINTAGWVRVDDAEAERDACMAANADGPERLARACERHGVPLVTFSSDLVFDGALSSRGYQEQDATRPLNVYGESKAEAERRVLASDADALVIRTAAFFSPHDEHNFAVHALRALREQRSFAAAEDSVVSPTYVPDLVNAALDLLIDGETGVWHLANAGSASWAEFGRMVAESAGLDAGMVEALPGERLGWRATRPKWAALDTARARILPSLESAVERFTGAMA